MEIASLIGLLGPLSVTIALIVTGLLSRRLGEQTKARPYYLGFFAAAVLNSLSIIAQLLDLFFHLAPPESTLLWITLDDVLPALAVTIGVVFAWRYWSWLLAERD